MATPARAGDYTAYVCKTPSGLGIPLDTAWTPTVTRLPAEASEHCASGGPMTVVMGGSGGSANYPVGPVVGWTLVAPDHTSIVVVSGRRAVSTSMPNGDSPSATATYRFLSLTGAVVNQIEACQYQDCVRGDFAFADNPSNAFSFTPQPSGSLSVFINCEGEPATACVNPGTPRLTVIVPRLTLQLRDITQPTFESVTGTALAPNALAGTTAVNFVAHDQGAGVYEAIVALDGVERSRSTPAGASGTCADALPGDASDLEFRSVKPCPDSADVTAPIDTTTVADGTHELTVWIRDAAGNLTTVVSRQILVKNGSGTGGIAGLGSGGTQPAAVNGTGGDTGTAAFIADPKHGVRSARYGRKLTIKRRLVDAAKRPIVGASVDVLQRIDVGGTAWTHVATIQTDANGDARFVPVTTSSRRVQFAYSRTTGGAAASTAEIRVAVSAAMTITAQKHAVRHGGTIALSGAVKVDGLPGRARVELQYQGPHGWVTFATRPIGRAGRWSLQYRLARARNTTIMFRALLRPADDIAAVQSHSAATSVRVN